MGKPLACPFCNGENLDLETSESLVDEYFVSCATCNATGPVTDSEHDAIVEWNERFHRAPMPDAVAGALSIGGDEC